MIVCVDYFVRGPYRTSGCGSVPFYDTVNRAVKQCFDNGDTDMIVFVQCLVFNALSVLSHAPSKWCVVLCLCFIICVDSVCTCVLVLLLSAVCTVLCVYFVCVLCAGLLLPWLHVEHSVTAAQTMH